MTHPLSRGATFVLQRDGNGAWRSNDPGRAVQLRAGRLSAPFLNIDWAVGEAAEAVLADGDALYLPRMLHQEVEEAGYAVGAERALMIIREGRLQLAMGAVGPSPDPDVVLHDQTPNIFAEWSIVAEQLARPDTAFVWLDPAASDFEEQRARLRNTTAAHVVVAIAPADDAVQAGLHNSLFALTGRSSGSLHTAFVTSEFAEPAAWLAFVRALPRTYPRDDRVWITIDGSRYELADSQKLTVDGWHLWVPHIGRHFRDEPTRLGVARAQGALTMQMLVRSVWALKQGY